MTGRRRLGHGGGAVDASAAAAVGDAGSRRLPVEHVVDGERLVDDVDAERPVRRPLARRPLT